MPCDPQKLDELATIYANFFKSLTEEEKAKRQQLVQRSDDLRADMEQFMQETFTAADANGDGLLDQAEYTEYCRASIEQSDARFGRVGPPFDEARHQLEYECWNAITPGTDGLTLDDIKAAMGEARVATGAKMQQ